MQIASTVKVFLAVKLLTICFLQVLLKVDEGPSGRRDAIDRPVTVVIFKAQYTERENLNY